MAKSKITAEALLGMINQVKHPAIDNTLVNLGIVRDVKIKGKRVALTFAFPFPNIPIRERLIWSVTDPVKMLGAKVKYSTRVMTDDERQQFLALEKEGWVGL